MSQENIDIARRGVEAVTQGDYAAAVELASPAMTFEMAPGVHPAGMKRVYKGHEGLRDFRSLLFDVFEHYETEIEDVRDSGDHVLCVFRERGVRRISGAGVDRRLHNVWTMKDGKMVRARFYLDATEAREAAGLDA